MGCTQKVIIYTKGDVITCNNDKECIFSMDL